MTLDSFKLIVNINCHSVPSVSVSGPGRRPSSIPVSLGNDVKEFLIVLELLIGFYLDLMCKVIKIFFKKKKKIAYSN